MKNGAPAPHVYVPLRHRSALPMVHIPDKHIDWGNGPKIVRNPELGKRTILTPDEQAFGEFMVIVRGKWKTMVRNPKNPSGKNIRPQLSAWFTFGPKSPKNEIMTNLQDCVDTIAKGLEDFIDERDMRNYGNKLVDQAVGKLSQHHDIDPRTLRV